MDLHRSAALIRWTLSVLSLIVPVRGATAQEVEALPRTANTILASATVVLDRVSVAALRPVAFAAARHGRQTTVQPTDGGAGAWRLVGTSHAVVQMKLTLPSELVNLQVPAAAVPIEFPPTAGRWRQDVNEPAGGATFDPQLGTAGQFGLGPNPTLFIWLGSTVQPNSASPGGTYRGTITLTVSYL